MLILNVSITNTPVWVTVISIIAGSAGISSIITNLWNNKIKKQEFEWSYKTYILENRKKAYNETYVLILKVFEMKQDSSGQRYCAYFELPNDEVIKLNDEFVDKSIYKEWFSIEMANFMLNLNHYLVNSMFNLLLADQQIKTQNAYSRYNTMFEKLQEFSKIYWNDVSTLHEIDSFLKSKKKSSTQ